MGLRGRRGPQALGEQHHLTREPVSSPASASSRSGTERGGHFISPGLSSPSVKWGLGETTVQGPFRLEAWPSGWLTHDEKALLSRSLASSRASLSSGFQVFIEVRRMGRKKDTGCPLRPEGAEARRRGIRTGVTKPSSVAQLPREPPPWLHVVVTVAKRHSSSFPLGEACEE